MFNRENMFPLNPVMDVAVFNKLQDFVFIPYTEALDSFISQVAPYFQIPVSFKETSDRDTPILIINKTEGLWFSELFQELIIIFASFDENEVSAAREKFHSLTDENERHMTNYDAAEAKSIIYKLFQQTMYLSGLIDEVNQRVKIPAYRYRTRIGMTLSYAPSLPLQSLTSIICDRFEVSHETDLKLVENFCVFYWNLKVIESDDRFDDLLKDYIQKATPLLRRKNKSTESSLLLDDIGEFIDFVLSDDFSEDLLDNF